MASKVGKSRLARADAIIKERVDQIDDDIAELERLARPYLKIRERIERLRSARCELLGSSHATGGGNSKVRQEDVVEFLTEHPGSVPSQIAKGLGTKGPTISTHLYRGNNDRFITKNGKWWVRDPEAGLDTPDDIEED